MIAKTFTDSFTEVKKLVDNFHQHIDEYLKPKYQEAEVRQDFLDKFFVALGWDVYHHENQNPYEREVKIEKSVMVQGRGKRADYAFYTAPNFTQARFMAEAKKPSKQLENAQDCFQAIRYGWNSNTPISVLTDFEQFLVLDSRYKPTIETAMQRIIREKSYKYTDFADEEKFGEIYYLFSREAVVNDSLGTFAKSLKGGRGARQSKLFNTSIIQPMDEEFLSELDEQRVVLAKAFKNRNAELDGETLTEITQRTLDRLVFLRFLEDKLVEPDSVIDNLGKKSGSAWRDFIGEMPRLNSIYNGTLFRSHSVLDAPDFAPDARAFEQTRDWLSHFNSPYDFNVIPIHILGSIYERFLGKTIVATDKRATIEDKPEVRKAGGVYYTPEYIVRYIVENTIGKLIEKKEPEEITEMRFADIACGSGSFLLGVFDYLIAYHVEWFSENKTRRAQAVKDGLCRETIEGVLQLTINYKREILLNNIYGVDLDAQAVEVAQLSLYLKLLEEETTATKQQFLSGFREQLLPSLNKNIVHGNSLIDYDIMDGMLFDTRELKQLNPMNFQSTFPEVFQKGGFDAIVGNPPYVRMEVFKPIKNYLKNRFDSHDERSDLYSYFIEQANKLLNKNGYYGVIVSNKFLRANYGKPLREYLAENTNVEQVIDFAGLPVFLGATVRTVILITSPKNGTEISTVYAPPLDIEKFKSLQSGSFSVSTAIEDSTYQIPNNSLHKEIWNFSQNESNELLDSLKSRFVSLNDYCNGNICMGVKSGLTKAFVIDAGQRLEILRENPEADEIIKPFLNGRDVRHYQIESKNQFLIYTYHGIKIEKFPAVKKHLEPFKDKLNKRATKQAWYELQQPQLKFAPYMESPKIIFPDISTTTRFALDLDGHFGSNTTYFIPKNDLYLLALLNSKLGFFYFSLTCAGLEGKGEIYLRFFGQYLEGFPIRTIDFSQPKEKAAHDKIVELAAKMLEAKKQLSAAQTDKDKTFYERYCSSLDTQIDELVFDLYDLTADEKKIIENS